jgi:hypothetical protein
MFIYDSKGYLKPYQPISCSVKDFKTHFVDNISSITRQLNFDNYIRYSNDLKILLEGLALKQWINGSFVTKKINPKDIDMVTFVDHYKIKELGSKLTNFKAANSWIKYGVDAYIIEVFPINNKSFVYTQSDTAYWLDLFNQGKSNRANQKYLKGFLEIIY